MENAFQHRLKRLREQKRMKQVVLSELCGLSRGAIGKYERGEQMPTLDAVTRIADYFEVSLDYLIGRANFR